MIKIMWIEYALRNYESKKYTFGEYGKPAWNCCFCSAYVLKKIYLCTNLLSLQ